MGKLPKLDEEAMIREEEKIPYIFETASAFQEALDAGLSVLIADGGSLWEVFPDGSRNKIKELPPATPVTAGARYTIQRATQAIPRPHI